MKSAPAGSRPPPLIIDHPPAKRARVSPLGAARHPRGQLPCVDPLGSASRPAAGVVTPPRGLAVPAAKTGRWTKREDETLRAVVEADATAGGELCFSAVTLHSAQPALVALLPEQRGIKVSVHADDAMAGPLLLDEVKEALKERH